LLTYTLSVSSAIRRNSSTMPRINPSLKEITMRRLSLRQMLQRCAVAALAVLVFASASAKINLSARNRAHAAPAPVAVTAPPQDSQCISTVPKSWGVYRGGSAQSGLSFEDSSGTLRFVTNLPCGSVPVVALEIRRSGNYN
jgi:hypothetical protein